MKKIFLLVGLLFAINTVFAQTLYTRKDTVLITQDSVTLQAGKFRGAIQWQYSTDKKTWNNLNGKIKETLKVIKSAEGYYRAEIIDHNCTPLYSDTAQIKPGFNISKTITAQAGGSITTPDNSTLTIPANSLQVDGKVTISTVEESELPVFANPNLQRFRDSYKFEIPGDTLLHNITLTFTLDSVPTPIENFVPYLYDGNSFIPMEYTINGKTLAVTIDVVKWNETNNLKDATTLSKFIIEFLISKQTPPEEEMGLKRVILDSGKLKFSAPSAISDTAKVLLLVHGWNDRPQTWQSFVQKITAEKSIKFSQIWTFGYNSSWSIEENASRLAQAITTLKVKVKIVAHSMGGLVSRSMIEKYGGSSYVRKLITLGTPHHGSPVAALRYLLGTFVSDETLVNDPSETINNMLAYNYNTEGFRDLYVGSLYILKMRLLAQPPVPYYCIAGISSIDLPLVPGSDDGVVSVESALGIPNSKGTAIFNINSKVAHLALLTDGNVYQKVKEYLADKDTILVISGNKQTGYPASKLAQPIVVQVQDEAKKPVKSKSVFFSFAQGVLAGFGLKSAQINVSEDKTDTLALETDNEGKISLDWTLGENGGDQKFEAFLKDDGNTKIDSSAIKITATACGCDPTKFGRFTDSRDGHVYKTIKIGQQTWMAENLAYKPYVSSRNDSSSISPRYYVHDPSIYAPNMYNYSYNSPDYGILYNRPAALVASPQGWHLPSDAEWDIMITYLGGQNIAGGSVKSDIGWYTPNEGATNNSCFSALPAGMYDRGPFTFGDNGFIVNVGFDTQFWSSSVPTIEKDENQKEYIKGLSLCLNYYYASISSIHSYGASISRTIKLIGRQGHSIRCIQDDVPITTTLEASSITAQQYFSGGNILSDGGKPVVTRGVCWNTKGSPTINDNKTTDGSGIGTFTSTISNLTPCTTYYARAYATNSMGTAYGEQITFTTLADKLPCLKTKAATAITDRSATSGGEITNEGDSPVTIRGVCWNTTGLPTIADLITNDGDGTGNFTSNMIALNNNTKYYVRAYATNAGTAYGNEVTFTTLKEAVIPVVTTHGITDITATSATCGGTVTDNNGSDVTVRGICWNTTGNPTTGDSKTTDGTGDGDFISKMTGLTSNTKYYIRAYATNKNGTGYGGQVFFITNKE